MDLSRLLGRLPKAELHVHLRGAVPVEVLRGQIERYGVRDLVDRAPARLYELWLRADNLRPLLLGHGQVEAAMPGLFAYQDFDGFLATYAFTGYFFRDLDDFARLVSGVMLALARQRIVYAEVMVSVREYLNQGLLLDDLLEVLETTERPGLTVRWIVDLVRNFGPEAALSLTRDLVERRPETVIGITLGGSEHAFPPELFRGTYRVAAGAGLRLTCHAGEALGADSVREAIDGLGAERIGHGIRAIEDRALVEELAERGIPLEVCPTSNLYTGVVPFYHEHPVTDLLEAGVPVSINTDDPTFFHTSLVEEYLHLHDMGSSESELLAVVRNGYQHAFAPDDEKAALLAAFDREVARLTRKG